VKEMASVGASGGVFANVLLLGEGDLARSFVRVSPKKRGGVGALRTMVRGR
jgi:hypothetical protein